MPFVPDITDWFVGNHAPKGEPRKYRPGALVSDSEPIREYQGTIPDKYKDYTLLDFYREYDWGFHAHIYDWFDTEYTGGVESITEIDGNEKRTYLRTPKGELVQVHKLAADGTWCPREHYVKELKDLEILQIVLENSKYIPKFEYIQSIMDEIGDLGQVDFTVYRSPFGKLVHIYMGLEKVVYALMDAPELIHDFLKLQEEKDMEVVRLAVKGPQKCIMISDHADENLISPDWYEEYCIPFYQKAGKILHEAGKYISTHLDGNFKGHFHLLDKTGFDILDGCTPAPMFNYGVEELAAAMPEGMVAFRGVPSTLFCQKLPTEKILAFSDRIMEALKGRAIINVGDILPPNGNIEQVIALGNYVESKYI